MKIRPSHRLLLTVSLFACLLVICELFLTGNNQPLTTALHRSFRVLEPYRTNLESNFLSNRRGQNLRKLLEDDVIRNLPVQISTNCTSDQLYRSVSSRKIICINETRLWHEVSQNGVKINQLSDLQAKSAIIDAVIEEVRARNLSRRDNNIDDNENQLGLKSGSKVDSREKFSDNHDDKLPHDLDSSFYELAVASFVKEAGNKPSDFAIPNLDSYYERHMPPEKGNFEEDDMDDFDGLFPDDVKRNKKVKQPFFPLIVEDHFRPQDELHDEWDNPFNQQWRNSRIPGIPPMPDKPPSLANLKLPHQVGGPQHNIQPIPPNVQEFPTRNSNKPPNYQKVNEIQRQQHEKVYPPLNRHSRQSEGNYHKQNHNKQREVSSKRVRTNRPAIRDRNVTKNNTKHATPLNDDLLQLRSFKFRKNFDLILRKLPTRFKFDGVRIKDRLKYIEVAVNATDPVLKDIVEFSLNPDILERAKVCVCVCVCMCVCVCVWVGVGVFTCVGGLVVW